MKSKLFQNSGKGKGYDLMIQHKSDEQHELKLDSEVR